MSKKREILKLGLGIITSIGVGAITGNAIKMVRPRNVGLVKDLCIGVGALVLTSMVSDKANQYTDEKIDEVADGVDTLLGRNKGEPEVEAEVV